MVDPRLTRTGKEDRQHGLHMLDLMPGDRLIVVKGDRHLAKEAVLPSTEKRDRLMRGTRGHHMVANLVHQLDHLQLDHHLKVTGDITGVRELLPLEIVDRHMTGRGGTPIREGHLKDRPHLMVDKLHHLRDGRPRTGRSRLDQATQTGMMITGAGPHQGTLITGNPLLQRGDTVTSGMAVTIPSRLLILTARMTMIDTRDILLIISLVNLTFKMF